MTNHDMDPATDTCRVCRGSRELIAWAKRTECLGPPTFSPALDASQILSTEHMASEEMFVEQWRNAIQSTLDMGISFAQNPVAPKDRTQPDPDDDSGDWLMQAARRGVRKP